MTDYYHWVGETLGLEKYFMAFSEGGLGETAL